MKYRKNATRLTQTAHSKMEQVGYTGCGGQEVKKSNQDRDIIFVVRIRLKSCFAFKSKIIVYFSLTITCSANNLPPNSMRPSVQRLLNILVPVKRQVIRIASITLSHQICSAVDYSVKIRVNPQQTGIDTNVKHSMVGASSSLYDI